MASDPTLELSLNLNQSGEHPYLVTENLAQATQVVQEALSVTTLAGSQHAEAGGGGSQNSLGLLLTYFQAQC